VLQGQREPFGTPKSLQGTIFSPKKVFREKVLTMPRDSDTLVNAPDERGATKKRTGSDEATNLDRKIV
jgi:hypothetical protein